MYMQAIFSEREYMRAILYVQVEKKKCEIKRKRYLARENLTNL